MSCYLRTFSLQLAVLSISVVMASTALAEPTPSPVSKPVVAAPVEAATIDGAAVEVRKKKNGRPAATLPTPIPTTSSDSNHSDLTEGGGGRLE